MNKTAYVASLSLSFIFLLSSLQPVFGFFFERRPKALTQFTYVLLPVVINVPGSGSGSGLGFYSVGLLGEETALIAGKIEGDLNAEAVWILDVPTAIEQLFVSPTYIRVKNLEVDQYQTGSSSPSEPSLNFQAAKLDTIGLELSYQRFERRLEFYISSYQTKTTTPIYISSSGEDFSSGLKQESTSRINRAGAYLDDTDDQRDPHIGYRVKYERWQYSHEETTLSDSYQDDLDLSLFLPLISHQLIWVMDVFYSQSTVTNPSKFKNDYPICDENSFEGCEEYRQAVIEEYESEAALGSATSLGGSQRMRAYPSFRFQDAYSFFIGNEIRFYAFENWLPFDYLVAKGVYSSLQLAIFYELGQVSSVNDATLFRNFKESTGVGIRATFSDAVFRIDYAFGDEGSQTTVFWGYPF